jgi:pilus assembly protein Flp/PilA
MKSLFGKFLTNESGATSIEYAMIAAGVAAVIIVTVTGLGSNVKDQYVSVQTALK